MNSPTVVVVASEPGVMVVCWDPHLLHTIGHCLAGFRVFWAVSSVQAVSLYQQHQEEIDLVLLNLSMPPTRHGGLAVFDALRTINPAVRCAFMSAFADEDDVADLMCRGAVGFLHKPFQWDEFVKAMRELSLR